MMGELSRDGVFSLRSGETWRAPWEMYARLRAATPVLRVIPDGRVEAEYFVLSRYADVLAAARDSATFSSAYGLTVEYEDLERLGLGGFRPFVFTDPPEHTDFRRRVAKGFTPRQVSAAEPAVRAFAVDRIERLRAAGGGDIAAELFKPLPTMVVAHYLGVPEEDRPRFDAWTDAIVAGAAGGPALKSAAARQAA